MATFYFPPETLRTYPRDRRYFWNDDYSYNEPYYPNRYDPRQRNNGPSSFFMVFLMILGLLAGMKLNDLFSPAEELNTEEESGLAPRKKLAAGAKQKVMPAYETKTMEIPIQDFCNGAHEQHNYLLDREVQLHGIAVDFYRQDDEYFAILLADKGRTCNIWVTFQNPKFEVISINEGETITVTGVLNKHENDRAYRLNKATLYSRSLQSGQSN